MNTESTLQTEVNGSELLSNQKLDREEKNKKKFETVNLNIDTQVKINKQRAPKRTFSNAYKLQILNAIDACTTATERAALLRKEGLYYARISTWRKQFQGGKFVSNKTPQSILLNQQLTREVASLKKKLAQAEAIIEVQKKVSELFSISMPDQEMSEMRS